MRSSWQGEPALVCDRPHCLRTQWLRFSRSSLGRVLVALWIVLAVVGLLSLVTGCRPYDETPRPLQTGRQDAPTPGFTVYRQER